MQRRFDPLMVRRRVLPVLVVVCGLAVLAAPGVRGEETGREPSHDVAPGGFSRPSDLAAARVTGDLEPGHRTSGPAADGRGMLSAALATALSRSGDDLQAVELEGGGRGVDLDGRFQHVVVVRVLPDGSFETSCVDHLHHAKALLLPDPAKAAPEAQDR